MFKPAGLFVASAIAVTAACVGVIATYGLGLSAGEGALAGVSALALMAVAHLAMVRTPGLDQARLDDLDRLATQLQSRFETLDVRISTLDAAVSERAKAASRPLVEEIAALGGLVTSIAKEVASHEAALTALTAERPAEVRPALADLRNRADDETPPARAAAPAEPAAPRAPAAPNVHTPKPKTPKPQAPDAFDPLEAEPEHPAPAVDRGLAARVELALRDDRIDFYLQPVVSLPNRRVVHYEGLSRLREPDGLALPGEFLPAAAAEGRLAEIDRRAIERGAKVAARLHASGRNVGVFVNIDAATLADDRALADVLALVDGSPDVARLLALELTLTAFDGLASREREARDALAARGVRFAVDQATSLGLDPRDLARRGVRFVKIAAETLFEPDSAKGAAFHPSDLSNLMARHGVELIATHVESEREVPELLDLEIRTAQGHLFGVPRPVREEPQAQSAAQPEPPRPEPVTRRFAPRPFVRRA